MEQGLDFAEELRRFRARVAEMQPKPSFDGLILLATDNPKNITAALLLGTLAVKRIACLMTSKTQDFEQRMIELVKAADATWECSAWLCPPGDHSDTRTVYQSVKTIREIWGDVADPARIAVDVTGGMKPMSVGVEKAAHLLELTTIYIESDFDRGRVQSGTQRLVIPPNPYTVFGDLEAAEAQRLFNAYDYVAAQRIFADLARRLPENGEYAAFASLAATYAAWDVFDYPQAHKHLAELLQSPAAAMHPFTQFRDRLTEQLAVIYTLEQSGTNNDRTTFSTLRDKPEDVFALLGSLYASAQRREAQQRYDFAALLLYRSLELMSRRRLAIHGIDTEEDNLGLFAQYCLLSGRSRWVGRGEQRRQIRIDRADAMMERRALNQTQRRVAQACGDATLAIGEMLDLIRDRTEARNKSVLAHGFKLITQEQLAQFRNVTNVILERFLAVESQVRGDEGVSAWLEPFQLLSI